MLALYIINRLYRFIIRILPLIENQAKFEGNANEKIHLGG